jgi:hypothetical protein
MQGLDADAASVVWVGDLGPRVTEAALRNVFSQARRCARAAVRVALGGAPRRACPRAVRADARRRSLATSPTRGW